MLIPPNQTLERIETPGLRLVDKRTIQIHLVSHSRLQRLSLTREDGEIQAEVVRHDRRSEIRPVTLHVMVWDPDEERLVNVRLPLWVLRFGDNATVDFSEADVDIVGDLDVSLEDIDYHGPGLVLDYQDEDPERVLLWTE